MRCDSTPRSRERSACRRERSSHRWARRCRRTVGGMCVVGALGAGVAASAQEPETPSRLLVEEIRSGFVAAPELKLTSIDGGSGAVAGMYGGFITDRRLLIGAGAYWLTSGPGSVDMAYGGGLVEWFGNPDGRMDFSVRGLVGAGRATLGPDIGIPLFRALHGDVERVFHIGRGYGRQRGHASHGRHPVRDDFAWPRALAFRYREDFVVAEPQLAVHLNVTDWLRAGGGAGYRFIAHAGRDGERLQGLTASFGLQLGPP